MVCTILIQLVFSLFFNKLLFDFIFSNINLKFIFLLFAYFLMPFGVKYIDEAFDSKTFNKKIATFVALILVIIGIFSLIIDPITAVFISGYIIGVLLTKKVDIKEYILFSIGWLVAVVFLGVHIYLINNLLLLIIFILLTIFDEKGNNYADNYFKKFKTKNYFVLLLRFRIIVLIGAIILSVLGLLPLEYVLLIFIWLLGYNLPIFISEQLKH